MRDALGGTRAHRLDGASLAERVASRLARGVDGLASGVRRTRRLRSRRREAARSRRSAAALAVWWIQAIAMPLAGGRDFGTYLGAFVELFQSDPIDLGYVLGRTPIAPLAMGGLLVPFGGALAEPLMSLLYAASILAWFLAARRFGGGCSSRHGRRPPRVPGLRDPVPRARIGLGVRRGVRGLVIARCAGAGAADDVGLRASRIGRRRLLTLVRPGNQVLVVLALMAFALAASWRARAHLGGRVRRARSCVIARGWTFTTVCASTTTRSRAEEMPSSSTARISSIEIVRPDNGPASRALARAVARIFSPRAVQALRRDDGAVLRGSSPRMLEDSVRWSIDDGDGTPTRKSWGRSPSKPFAPIRSRTRAGSRESFGNPPEAVVSYPRARRGAPAGERCRDDWERFHRDQRQAPPTPVRGRADTGRTRRRASRRRTKHSNRLDLDYEHHLVFEHPGDRAAIRRAPSQDDGARDQLPDAPAWRRSLSGSTRRHDGFRRLSCGSSSESSRSRAASTASAGVERASDSRPPRDPAHVARACPQSLITLFPSPLHSCC